ncbi:hypothetical protein AAMO2058_001721600 [Amorphochlora amoebiformis]
MTTMDDSNHGMDRSNHDNTLSPVAKNSRKLSMHGPGHHNSFGNERVHPSSPGRPLSDDTPFHQPPFDGKKPPRPYIRFQIEYDPWTHKALEHRLGCSQECCARPHMRAFHLAWSSFLVAFIAWFSYAPLAPVMRRTMGLSSNDILIANLTSVTTTVIARFVMGPIMDIIGPRKVQTFLLIFAAVPLFFSGFIQNAADLAAVRGLVGIVGATFVGCQFWTSLMFEQELAGMMNATAAGWGNLGGGLAQLIMVGIYNMNLSSPTCDDNCAWRNSFYIPAVFLVVAGVW